jgi:hypothetical protein
MFLIPLYLFGLLDMNMFYLFIWTFLFFFVPEVIVTRTKIPNYFSPRYLLHQFVVKLSELLYYVGYKSLEFLNLYQLWKDCQKVFNTFILLFMVPLHLLRGFLDYCSGKAYQGYKNILCYFFNNKI